MKKSVLKAAFPVTIPVLLGYLSIGIGFGLLIQSIGYNFIWAGVMSLVIYAGSMEYLAVDILNSQQGYIATAVMTLVVQMRHMVYGLSFIERFKNMGLKKAYMIFSLTDETYALLCAAKAPDGIDEDQFIFTIALLNQSYWILGSVIGAIAGSLLNINTRGIEFAMTALFVVIGTEQWLATKNHFAAILGLTASVISIVLFGRDNMLIPAIIGILVVLLVGQSKIKMPHYKHDQQEEVQ